MSGKLVREIHQTKPFGSLEQEAAVSISYTSEKLAQKFSAFLKPHGVSMVQYNVLRILRGAGPGGIPLSQIGERLISHDPDVTRLIDRMESSGLAARQRSKTDRRVVVAAISKRGLELVCQLDPLIEEYLRIFTNELKPKELKTLIELLERFRDALEENSATE